MNSNTLPCEPAQAPRQRCPQCLRALSSCICTLAQPIEHSVQLLILQHPMEVHEAKGTAQLLHLCLPHSRILVGEQFQPEALQQALWGDWPSDAGKQDATAAGVASCRAQVQPLLLYPDLPQAPVLTSSEALSQTAPAPTAPTGHLAGIQRLVVLDGTWRKSRKMLYLNPQLARLPRLSLTHLSASAYRIRKAQASGQLSSFEAAALALAQLHNWDAQHPAVLQLHQVFHSLMDHHERLRPPATLAQAQNGSSHRCN